MQTMAKKSPAVADPTEFRIRLAKPADVPAVLHYRNRKVYRDSGFCPAGGLEKRAADGRLWILQLRGQVAGFLNFSYRRDGICHVPQLVVDEEVWRCGYGTAAMQRLIDQATAAGLHSLTLKTAVGGMANQFWPVVGLRPVGLVRGRKRPLIAWSRPLGGRLNLFGESAFPPASTWGFDPSIVLPDTAEVPEFGVKTDAQSHNPDPRACNLPRLQCRSD